MYTLKYDSVFRADYKRVMRKYPQLRKEFAEAVRELAETGALSEACSLHLLTHSHGTYTGHMDFHLSNGKVDVVALYMPHKSERIIRFVRMGSHDELFHGSIK